MLVLGRRSLSVLVLLFVLLVVNAFLSLQNLEAIRRSQQDEQRAYETMLTVEKVMSLLGDAETGQRGFLLTGDDAYLAPYTDSTHQISRQLAALRATPDLPIELAQPLVTLNQLVQQKLNELARTIALGQAHDPEAALAVVRGGEGKRTMDRIREIVEQIDISEAQVLDNRKQVVDSNHQNTQWTLAAASGAAIALLGAIAFFVQREHRRRAHIEAQLREERSRFEATIVSIGDGVIATDTAGRITLMNPVAERLTGWLLAEAAGLPLERVFEIVNETTRAPVESPVEKVLRTGEIAGLANHTILIARDGREIPIDDSGAPIRGQGTTLLGVVLVFRDISERHDADLALRDSEDRYRTLVTSITQTVWNADEHGYGTEGLPFWEKLTGQRAEESVHSWLDLVHPDDRERVIATWTQAMAEKIRFEYTYRVHGREGDWRHLLVVGMPRWTSTGTFREWIGTISDISDTKRYEEAILASEWRYRSLANAIPLPVFTAQPDGTIDYVNNQMIAYTGALASNALDEVWWQAIHPDDRAMVQEQWRNAMENDGTVVGEVRLRHARGTYRWFLTHIVPARDAQGTITSWIGTSTDIDVQRRAIETERLLADASRELGQSMEYRETLIATGQVLVPAFADAYAVWLLGEDGPVKCAETVRETRHDAITNTMPEEAALEHVFHTNEPLLVSSDDKRDDRLGKHPAEEGRVVALWFPLFARGHILGVLKLQRFAESPSYGSDDIALAEEIARRIGATIDNIRLYQETEQAVRAREQFLSIASHELKTPLTSLLGYAELLQRRAERDPAFQERDQRAIAVMLEQVERLYRMVTSLLDISRLQSGQLSIERGLLNLSTLLQGVVDETQVTLRRHTIRTEGGAQALIIEGDELRLEQVFQNLLQNAIKYTPNGGEIVVTLERTGDEARVRIRDCGIGIPSDELPFLFTRFYRAKNTDGRKISGMGLGLYVVKEIVALHQGTIDVQSVEDQGSVFTVCLPGVRQFASASEA